LSDKRKDKGTDEIACETSSEHADDNHIPNMTVLETARFGASCQLSTDGIAAILADIQLGENNRRLSKQRLQQLPEGSAGEEDAAAENANTDKLSIDADAAAAEEKEEQEFDALMKEAVELKLKPWIILRLLGLSHCADTFVGNEILRGVSGGERKRVTTAEILVGPKRVVFMDEISTGLDSATTFTVVSAFRDACHALNSTIVVSLLQPAPEVMALFDDIIVLTEGRVLFHGPVKEAVPFFAGLPGGGFVCPIRKDPGSFLQEITTPAGQLAFASVELLAAKGMPEEAKDPDSIISAPPKELLVGLDAMAGRVFFFYISVFFSFVLCFFFLSFAQ
jgi:energy-coupling factor transporter ATP-binding protein EcfA2